MKRFMSFFLSMILVIGTTGIVLPQILMAEGESGSLPPSAISGSPVAADYFGAQIDYTIAGITIDSYTDSEVLDTMANRYILKRTLYGTATAKSISINGTFSCLTFGDADYYVTGGESLTGAGEQYQFYTPTGGSAAFEYILDTSPYSETGNWLDLYCGLEAHEPADPQGVTFGNILMLECHFTIPASTTVIPSTAPSSPGTAAPTSTPTQPPIDRFLQISGAVYDITDSPMPYIRMCITPSFGSPVFIQTTQYGGYNCKIPLPADQTAAFDVKIEVFFRCWLDTAVEFQGKTDRTAFYMTDLADSNASQDIITATTIHLDPSLPEYKDAATIPIDRALNFKTIIDGYFSSDVNGTPDAFSSNISTAANLPAYSYVYHELINGLMFGVVQMGERTSMLIKMPLKVELNLPGISSEFDQNVGIIRYSSNRCTFTDTARYGILHEFGHFFEWSTNKGEMRCKRDTRILGGDTPHGGFFNAFTADSFDEGFATWYAGAVQRFGLYVEPNPAAIGEWTSLDIPRKAWDMSGLEEEFAISHVMYQLLDFMTIKQFWTVFKPDRDNLQKYYEALTKKTFLSEIGKYDDLKKTIDNLFIECDLFKMPFGSGSYEVGEHYIDSNKNNEYDAGEVYWDTMYDQSTNQLLKPLNEYKLILGKPEAYNQPRDVSAQATGVPGPAVGTIYRFPNSWLLLTGSPVNSVRIFINLEGAEPWAYLAPVENGKVYIGIPGESAAGTIEISIPGGGTIWSEDISVLNKQFKASLGTETPLSQATVSDTDLAPAGTIACPLGGSVTASGILEKEPVTNSEAALLAVNDSGSEDPFAITIQDDGNTVPDNSDTTSADDSQSNNDNSTQEKDNPSPFAAAIPVLGYVGAGLLGILLIIGMVIILVFLRRKRKQKNLPSGQDSTRNPIPSKQTPITPLAPYPLPKGYSGQHKNGVPNGTGRLLMSGGELYEGQFLNGRFHGKGVMRWTGGQVYSGEWANGVQNGLGRQTDAVGRVVHDGRWINGKPVQPK